MAIRHRLALDRLNLPKDISLGGLAGSFLVPGLAVYLRGPRLWGKAALTACALLFLFFIVWLGHPFGNFAFGLILSIHASGFVYYCSPFLINERLRFRLVFTVLTLIGLGLCLYLPLRSAIQNHALTPLRVNGQVVVVGKFSSAHSVKRGDWIAYTLSGYMISNHGYESDEGRAGMGFGPVLAASGDLVEFSASSFAVNGVSRTNLPHMPVAGTLTLPENHWFIWPSYSISGQGNESQISARMLQMADVSADQFIGKPLTRWFWRKQILP